MEEIYFVDRPTIPAISQVVIHLDAVLEHSVDISASDIDESHYGEAVEVKDSNGDITGTLVYFPCTSYADLVSQDMGEKEPEEELEELIEEPSTPDDGVATPPSDDLPYDSAGIEDAVNAMRQERLLNLELELSAAKQHVQDLEDEISDEEGALD